MQLKHKHLLNILQEHDYKINSYELKTNKNMFLRGSFNIMEMYVELGGLREEYPHLEKEWYYIDPLTVIVLDEYLHFNRYRNITLRSDLYEKLPYFPLDNYRRYCRNFEKECIKPGLQKGIWSNKDSDYFFGASAAPGDFFKNGSGGWKRRAFQDYIEDAAAVALNFKLVRFSVYDNFLAEGKLVRLDNILERPAHPLQNQLLKYVIRRINQ